MNTMYAVIADYNLEALYKGVSTANRRIRELDDYPVNWRQSPTVYQVSSADDLPEFFRETPAYAALSHWLENGRSGKRLP